MSRSFVAFVIALVLTGGYAKLNGIWPFDGGDGDLVTESVSGQLSDEDCARAYREGMAQAQAEHPGSLIALSVEGCEDWQREQERLDARNAEQEGREAAADDPPEPYVPTYGALPPAVDGVRVLYDGLWQVDEGQWWIGNGEAILDVPNGPTFRRMFESVGAEGAYVTVPGDGGRYRARVELHDQVPSIPHWCADGAEVSVNMPADPSPFQMGSFETYSPVIGLAAGAYRLRYCTEKQDLAADQDPYASYPTTYQGRHLFQLWKAPRALDRTLRISSAWARDLERD